MTICIAAVSDPLGQIVLVSDALLSDGWISTDGVMKFDHLQGWVAMCAGDEAHRFPPLIRAIRKQLTGPGSAENLMSACRAGFKAELTRKIESEILLPLNLSQDDFVQLVADSNRDSPLQVMFEQIATLDLGVGLLVAGFDENERARIFEVTGRGVIQEQQLDFHTIGSGALPASYVLSLDPHYFATASSAGIIYKVCTAKFAAESVPTVGRGTTVIVMPKEGPWSVMVDKDVDELRSLWQAKGRSHVPDGAADLIGKRLRQAPPGLSAL